MNTMELTIVGLVILYPDLLSRLGDFEPIDFELRDLYRTIERWIDSNRDRMNDAGLLLKAIDEAGHVDLAARCLAQDGDESLLAEYLESWNEQ